MKVEKVSATIRYSQDTGKGAWKVIEIGAEGSVDTRENWQAAQAYLYAELGKQMRQLWHNGNGAALNGNVGAESPVEPLPEPAPVLGRQPDQNIGAPPTKWPTPRRTGRVERPGGAIRRRTGAGAGSREMEPEGAKRSPPGSWKEENGVTLFLLADPRFSL